MYICYSELERGDLMKLIFAEKPDVARQFRDALDSTAKTVKFADRIYYYEGKELIFASAFGHLFAAKLPSEIDEKNKEWKAEKYDLPDILPLKPIDNTRKKYFQCLQYIIKNKNIDEIIVCTDPDREGQLIWELIQRNLSTNVPVTRAWIKEWPAQGLIQAFNSRKLNSTYRNLANAGLCRLQADYIIGLTATRVNTVTFGGPGVLINDGRVQSPTRYMVYMNDQAIKNFKPEDYYVLNIKTESDESSLLSLTSSRLAKEQAIMLQDAVKNKKLLLHKTVRQTRKKSPKLYKTNSIIVDASKKFGISSEETMNILQSLYQDHGLTTYPRTEIEQISQSAAKNVMKIVNSLEGIATFDDIVGEIKSKNYQYQSHLIDSKGGEMPHEAITPTYTGNPRQKYSKLTPNEKKIYELIVMRFLQGFYPPAILEETEVWHEAICDGEKYSLKASGTIIVDPSWLKLSKDTLTNDILPLITDKKQYICQNTQIVGKKTQPPARYTEATLYEAMENAGRFVDDKDAKTILKEVKGIGTGATRTPIVKKLFDNDFLTRKGKSIYPTDKTIQISEIMPNSPLTSPIMTAELETKLSQVEDGSLSFDCFMEEVYKQVDEIIKCAKNAPQKRILNSEMGKCPVCGHPIKETKISYRCSAPECGLVIWKKIAGKTLAASQIEDLIKTGKTKVIKGFKPKDGKSFDAKLKLEKDDKGRFSVVFDNEKDIIGVCPRCGSNVVENSSAYSCQNKNCHFFITKNNRYFDSIGTKLTKTLVKRLLKNGEAPVKGLVSKKTGKKYDAIIVLNDTGQYVNFNMKFK